MSPWGSAPTPPAHQKFCTTITKLFASLKLFKWFWLATKKRHLRVEHVANPDSNTSPDRGRPLLLPWVRFVAMNTHTHQHAVTPTSQLSPHTADFLRMDALGARAGQNPAPSWMRRTHSAVSAVPSAWRFRKSQEGGGAEPRTFLSTPLNLVPLVVGHAEILVSLLVAILVPQERCVEKTGSHRSRWWNPLTLFS